MSTLTSTSASTAESESKIQIRWNEVIFNYVLITPETVLNYEGKTIRFVDCTFEEWISEIPSGSEIKWQFTMFRGPCKFGDAIKISGVKNGLWDNHTLWSWCIIQNTTIGNHNTFGFGTEISAGATIGDNNTFDSGTEVGNLATIGRNNTFGRNSIVSVEEIAAIGRDNLFRPGSQVGSCVWFFEGYNIIEEQTIGQTHESVTFDENRTFPEWCVFKNCKFLKSCTFGDATRFDGGDTVFAEPCKFWDRTQFHIHNFGNGHTVGSWWHIQYFSESSKDKQPGSGKYRVMVGDDNTFGYGLRIDHGAGHFGNRNIFDSGAKIWNFSTFGDGNVIGRFARGGKELRIGADNIWRPGCQVQSFAEMWKNNAFDTGSPVYAMTGGALDRGERTDTREWMLIRTARVLKKILPG